MRIPTTQKILSGAAVAALAALVIACDSGNGSNGDDLRAQLLTEGEVLFKANCTGCHGVEGEGHSPHTPPLLHSDYLIAERLRPVRILTLGLPNAIDTATSITVNNVVYTNQEMPPVGEGMTDREIAAILTFLRVELNDSTSVNCRAPIIDEESNPHADCDIVARPEAATDVVTPEEVTAHRATLSASL